MDQQLRTRGAPVALTNGGSSRQTLPLTSLNAAEPAATHVTGCPRTIAISAKGKSGDIRFQLSAGDAAELMFHIGYALEQAASSTPKVDVG